MTPAVIAEPSGYRVLDLTIDVERRRVLRGDDALPVVGISFDMLLALVRAAPKLLSVDALMQRVWPGLVVSPETVSQRVKILRRALGDDAERPRYIAGLRGRGYHCIAPVTGYAASQPNPLAEKSMSAPATVQRAPARFALRWYLGIAVCAVVLAGALMAYHRKTASPARPILSASAVSAVLSAPLQGVAVLPFVNLTGEQAKDYLGEGMAEEIINTLTKVPGLKVPARTSSFAYQGREVDVRQIARDLGVGAILEGSVREAGTRIRITAQLINAQNGLHIWSQTYDQNATDLLKLQEDLATAIVQALKIRLSDVAALSIAQSAATRDGEAYDLYLQGEALLQRSTPESLDRAVGYFQQALAHDPKLGRAYAGIGKARLLFAVLGQSLVENLNAAQRAEQSALKLDATLGEAHDVLAGIAAYRGDLPEAAAQFRVALSLNPEEGMVHMSYGGGLLLGTGHLHQALDELRQAQSLAPTSPQVAYNLANTYAALGRDAEAIKAARLAEDLGIPRTYNAFVYEEAARHSGRYADAAANLTGPDPGNPDQARAAKFVTVVYAALADPGKRNAAQAARTQLYPPIGRLTGKTPTTTYSAACIESAFAYALLGHLDGAYEWVNQCLDARVQGSTSANAAALWTPELRPFRQDSRFSALATRLGLMEYWQQYGPPDDCSLKDRTLTCH